MLAGFGAAVVTTSDVLHSCNRLNEADLATAENPDEEIGALKMGVEG